MNMSSNHYLDNRPQARGNLFALPSPNSRRRRDADALLEQRAALHNSSSSSSEILVAAPSSITSLIASPQRPRTDSTPARNARSGFDSNSLRRRTDSTPARYSRSNTEMTKVSQQFGHLSIFFGSQDIKQRYRAILEQTPNPAPIEDSDSESDDQSDTQGDDDGEIDATDDEDDDENAEGPNNRGTYSKEYTQKHPEIKWVHRGQGRYLPASEVKVDPPASTPRPTRYLNDTFYLTEIWMLIHH